MSVDFTPSRGNYTELKPFRYWCQKVLPLVYDDSLSYYELLSKILDALNKAMEDVETLNDDVTALYEAYTALQNWVTAYAENLQNWVNNYVETFFEGEGIENAVDDALDRMVVSGEFGSIVNDKVASQINAVVASQLGTVVQGQLPSVVQSQIPGVVSSQLPGVVNNQIGGIVEDWLEANITPDTTLLDRTINATNKAPVAYDMKTMIQAMKSNYSFIDKYTMFDYPGDISTGRNDLAVMEYMTRTYGEVVSNRTVFMWYFKKGNSLILYNPNSDDLHCYPSLIPITRNLLPPLSADFAVVSQTMPTIPNVATSYNKNAILKYFVNLKSNDTVKITVDIPITVTGTETPVVCLTGWKLVKIYVNSSNNITTQNLADFVVTGSVADGKIHAECKYTFGDINKEAYDDPATVGFGLAILTGDTNVELTTYQEFEGEAVVYTDNTNFFPKGSGFNITITGEVVDTEVADLRNDLSTVSDNTPYSSDKWIQGTSYYQQSSNHVVWQNTTTRCTIRALTDKNLNIIKAKPGYQVSFLACTFDGTYYYEVYENPSYAEYVDVSQYAPNYYIIVNCKKTNNSDITTSEAQANVEFYKTITVIINDLNSRVSANEQEITEINTNLDTLNMIALSEDVTPDTVQTGKLYFKTNNTVINVSGGVLKKYTIVNTVYYATASLLAANTGFPLISYFDENDNFISDEYPNAEDTTITIENQLLNIPANAKWFYVNSRNFDPSVLTFETPEKTINQIIGSLNSVKKNEISILFVGNSLTQDGIAYLPYVLKTYYPDIKFKFYMWYNGGYTLAQQYAKFVADTPCDIFSVAENNSAWSNSSKKMSEVLDTYTFDIVCLQEYFNYKETYTASDLEDWNNCRDYIQENYGGDNGLEFISLFHAPLRSDASDVFALTKSGNALILQQTISEDMIANGIAVYRALSTDLDNLGDAGHLSPDGTHTQEGLPCLLQTYVTLLWIFDKLSINKSVYGLPMKMTTDIYNTLNVPGPNLGTGVITGTDAQNLLAQEVAIKAYKEGKQFVIANLFSNS